MHEKTVIRISKKQISKKAECSDEDFLSDPIITIGLENDSSMERGFKFRVKYKTNTVEFIVLSIVSMIKSANLMHNMYTLKVSRNIIPNAQ